MGTRTLEERGEAFVCGVFFDLFVSAGGAVRKELDKIAKSKQTV